MVATVAKRSAFDVDQVARLWPDSTVVCLGSGPSLAPADIEACRGRARVIAIKDTYQLAPWADALYCGDEIWWQRHGEATRTFAGLRFGLVSPQERRWVELLDSLEVHRLLLGSGSGLDADPRRLALGGHSGFQALNLAYHLGARSIVLLGYDMQPAADGRVHFFGNHDYSKKKPPYEWIANFASLAEPLQRHGIRVVNASRETALTVFPRVSLEEALA